MPTGTTWSLDDFSHDFHAWAIERGAANLELQFARFGGMGEDLALHESYACSIAGHDAVSLDFSKSSRWATELTAFIRALDTVGA